MNRESLIPIALALLLAALPSLPAASRAAGEPVVALSGGWEPVAGAPLWSGGAAPGSAGRGAAVFELGPGESTSVYLGEHAALMVVGKGPAEQDLARLTPYLSGDGSLFVRESWEGIGQEMLALRSKPLASSVFVRLEHAATGGDPLRFSVFLLRPEPGSERFARILAPEGPPVRVTQGEETAADSRHWAIEPGRTLRVEVGGASRIRLDSRYRYTTDDGESRQTYRLRAASGPRRWSLEHATSLSTRGDLFVDGAPEPLGSERVDILELAPGQRELVLESTAPLYVRVRGIDRDLLFPGLNSPRIERPLAVAAAEGSIWDLAPDDPTRLARGGDAALARLASWLVRDNDFRGSTAQLIAMNQVLADRSASSTLRKRWLESTERATSYTDLLPRSKADTGPIAHHGFVVPGHRLVDGPPPRRIYTELDGATLRGLASGYFVRTGDGRESAHRYTPARTDPPACLRIIVGDEDLRTPARLTITPDGQLPLEIKVLPRALEPASALERSSGELVVAQLDATAEARRRRPTATPPLHLRAPGSPVAELGSGWRQSSLIETSLGELCLPRSAPGFSLWSEPAGLQVAIQELLPRRFFLSEGEYDYHTDHLRSSGWSAEALFEVLVDPERPDPPTLEARPAGREALAALTNHWRPLARSLRALERSFVDGLVAPRPTEPAPALAPSEPAPEDPIQRLAWLVERERRFGIDRQLLAAKVEALDAAGERYLAERTLRQAALHTEPELAEDALRLLLRRYEVDHDVDGRLRAVAAVALHRPGGPTLAALAETLVEAGRYRDALAVAALGIEPLPPSLAQAALAERWWRTLDRTLSGLDDHQRQLWLGYRAFSEHRYGEAESRLRRSGELGAASLEAIDEGRRLTAKLADAKGDKRSRLSDEWRRWEAAHPGPHRFREEPWLVRDAGGAVSLSVPYLEGRLPYFRAGAERPVRIQAIGPARLRFELRALVENAGEPAGDVWVRLVTDDGEERLLLPSGARSRASNLTLSGSARRVGQKTELDIVIGEGVAALELFAEGAEVLTRVFAWRPLVPLVAHPGSKGRAPKALTAAIEDGRPWLCLASARESRIRECLPVEGDADAAIGARTASAPQLESARVQVLAGSPSAGDPSLYRTMVGYVRALESGSEDEARRAVALGEALFWGHRERGELAPLHSRIARRSTWQRLRSVEKSSGIRRVEGESWSPEDPALRVRRSLLRIVEPSDLVVVGRQRLGLSISSRAKSRFKVTFELAQVPPLSGAPVVAITEFDGASLEPVSVDLVQPQAVRWLSVPAGQHEIVFSIEDPRANQYLRLRVEEAGAAGPVPQVRSWQRDYHVATAERPLELRVDAPSWLRIDELRDGATISTYRLVDGEGWRKVEIVPEIGGQAAMYRVFERTLAEASSPLEPRTDVSGVEELATLGQLYIEPESRPTLRLPSRAELAAGGGGTQSLTMAVERRRVVEDEIAPERDAEEFTELSWAYRRGRERAGGVQRHQDFVLLARGRQDGEPTVGTELAARLQSPDGGWVFNAGLRGYAQDLESSGSEWSATARLDLARRFRLSRGVSTRLAVGGFGRELSADPNFEPQPGDFVDQDIFTSYKFDHRYGARLAQSLTARARRDFVLWSQFSLNSNEELGDLDNAAFELALRELLGAVRLDLRFRLVRYFADSDRAQEVDRQRVSLRWAWDRWTRRQGRWELGGRASYDIQAGQYSGTLFLSRHFSARRGLDDFRPVAADFRTLREERLPEGF